MTTQARHRRNAHGWLLLLWIALAACKDGEHKASKKPDGATTTDGRPQEDGPDRPLSTKGFTVRADGAQALRLREIVSPFSLRGQDVAFGRSQACHAVLDLETGEMHELPCTKPLVLPVPLLQGDHLVSFSSFKEGEIYARSDYGKKIGDFDAQKFAGASDRHVYLRDGDSLSAHPLADPSKAAWTVDLADKKTLATDAGLVWMDARKPSSAFGLIDDTGAVETLGSASGQPNGFDNFDRCDITAAYWDSGDKPRWQYEFFDTHSGAHVHSTRETGLISDLVCNDDSIGYLVWNSLAPSQLVMVNRASHDTQRSDLPKKVGYNGKIVMADVPLYPVGKTLYRFEPDAPASSKGLPVAMADQLHGAEIWMSHGRLLWSARQIFEASDGADPTPPRVSVYDVETDELVFDETYDLVPNEITPVEFWPYADRMRVIIQGRLREYVVAPMP